MIELYILTPEQTVYEGVIKQAIMPGALGDFQILKDHAPIVSTLNKGNIYYTDKNNDEHVLSVDKGIVEVNNNKITVLVF
jgi:F-type H+-transporting ATPase subunit epsilon